jgi:hypothetical protein
MMKLKITTDKTFRMYGIDSITPLQSIDGRQVDYRYSDPADTNPVYNYFEIAMNGNTKVLAVSGKVEQWEIPDTAQKVDEWEKPNKNK